MNHAKLKIQIGNALPTEKFSLFSLKSYVSSAELKKMYNNGEIVFILIPGSRVVYFLVYITQNPNLPLPYYSKFYVLFRKNIQMALERWLSG